MLLIVGTINPELSKNFDVEIAPDLILRGASRYSFGLAALGDAAGLPIPKVDMSGSIGMGRIIPGVGALGTPHKGVDDALGSTLSEAGGAALAIPINLMTYLSLTELPAFDPKRLEKAYPTAVRNASKAVRFYNEDRERSMNGATVLEIDHQDPEQMAEIIAQGLGFRPTRLAQKWDLIIAQREAAGFWATKRGLLLDQIDYARQHNDKEAADDAMAAIRRFNTETPYKDLRISRTTLKRSLDGRRDARIKQGAGLPSVKSQREIFRDVQELHPEVTVEKLR